MSIRDSLIGKLVDIRQTESFKMGKIMDWVERLDYFWVQKCSPTGEIEKKIAVFGARDLILHDSKIPINKYFQQQGLDYDDEEEDDPIVIDADEETSQTATPMIMDDNNGNNNNVGFESTLSRTTPNSNALSNRASSAYAALNTSSITSSSCCFISPHSKQFSLSSSMQEEGHCSYSPNDFQESQLCSARMSQSQSNHHPMAITTSSPPLTQEEMLSRSGVDFHRQHTPHHSHPLHFHMDQSQHGGGMELTTSDHPFCDITQAISIPCTSQTLSTNSKISSAEYLMFDLSFPKLSSSAATTNSGSSFVPLISQVSPHKLASSVLSSSGSSSVNIALKSRWLYAHSLNEMNPLQASYPHYLPSEIRQFPNSFNPLPHSIQQFFTPSIFFDPNSPHCMTQCSSSTQVSNSTPVVHFPTSLFTAAPLRSTSATSVDMTSTSSTPLRPPDAPLCPQPKRARSEVKKCRKIYGIEHKALWCNQCKWKKACRRFPDS